MLHSAYIETSVIGHLVGRLHPDPAISRRQQTTRLWWPTAPARYLLYSSWLTAQECACGEPAVASERLHVARNLTLLDLTDESKTLAALLIARRAVPDSKPRDASHISLAAVHRVDLIVTWNFRHILNPHLQRRIGETCREAGYRQPVICTPEQLWENENDS